MKPFKLDSRLEKDCFILSESEQFVLLLMNNSLVPWFILVPKTNKTELHELDTAAQIQLFSAINKISDFISSEFKPDKLNVAAIGNIVNQMHIHIIARYKTDAYWPGVVWGMSEKQAYELYEVKKITTLFTNILEL